MSEDRLSEVDNRSRATEREVEKQREALTNLQEAMEGLQDVIKIQAVQAITFQVMNEVIPRYMAGYQVGDYAKELEAVKDLPNPADFKLTVKDPNFDEERFRGLCKEVAGIIITARAEAARRQNFGGEQPSPLVTPGAKPALQVVKPTWQR